MNDPQYYDWLIQLDMRDFRDTALRENLIEGREEELLCATARSGNQVHNALLLAIARREGETSFHRLLDTLKSMGESRNKKWLQLVKLLPVTDQGMYFADLKGKPIIKHRISTLYGCVSLRSTSCQLFWKEYTLYCVLFEVQSLAFLHKDPCVDLFSAIFKCEGIV